MNAVQETPTTSHPSFFFWSAIPGISVALNFYNYFWLDGIFTLAFLIGLYKCFSQNSAAFSDEFYFKKSPFNFLILTFLISGILGYIFSSPLGPDQTGEIFGVRWILGFYAFYFVGRQFRRHHGSIFLSQSFILLSVSVIFCGFIWLTFKKYDGAITRMQGAYQNPNHFGLTMVLLWAFIAGTICFIDKKDKGITALLLLILLLTSVCTFLSYSRSSWLGAFCAAILCVFFRRNKTAYALFGVSIVAFMGLFLSGALGLKDRILYSFDVSNANAQETRFMAWDAAWNIFLDHPVFGVGFSENARIFPEYYRKLGFPLTSLVGNSHNQYLEILSGAGLVGLIGYLGIFAIGLNFFRRKLSQAETLLERQLALGSAALIAALLASSFTDTPFRLHETRNLLMILLGFSFGFLNLSNEKTQLTRDPLGN